MLKLFIKIFGEFVFQTFFAIDQKFLPKLAIDKFIFSRFGELYVLAVRIIVPSVISKENVDLFFHETVD